MAPAAWARSIARAIRGSGATSRSRCCPPRSPLDPDRLHRFEQEARAAAALNHPNILAVFDIGTHDGAPYIVSELLEGETLRERLWPAGALPVRKAVEYAVQIAHGLAAAHEKGIVHRDLKPENIFVTTDGRVKILDFGLAKLTQAEPRRDWRRARDLPTTPAGHRSRAWCSARSATWRPSRCAASPADHRADIFAFGAILYEMLSGRRAFTGETTADTMTAILKEDPPDLPAASATSRRPLRGSSIAVWRRVPAARFQSADDLGFALETLSTHSDTAAIALKAPAPTLTASRFIPWAAALVFLSVALVLARIQFRSPRPPRSFDSRSLRRREVFSRARTILRACRFLRMGSTSLSRSTFETASRSSCGFGGWIHSRREQSPIPSFCRTPRSPFSNRSGLRIVVTIGFFGDGKLKKVEVASGAVQTVSSYPGSQSGATWNNDGTILFGTSLTKGVQRVSADGGVSSQVTMLDAATKETAHLWPEFLPMGVTSCISHSENHRPRSARCTRVRSD